MHYTVAEHYAESDDRVPIEDPRQFDSDLRRIFVAADDAPAGRAGEVVHAASLSRDRVAHLVLDGRARRVSCDRSIDHLAQRAADLDLRVGGLEASTLIELTAFGTAVVMNSPLHPHARPDVARGARVAGQNEDRPPAHAGCARAAGRSGARPTRRRALRAIGHDAARGRRRSRGRAAVVSASTRPRAGSRVQHRRVVRGKSALESNVAALLNLLDLRYTGSSPAGLMLAGDKSLTKKVLRFHGIQTPQFATLFRGAVDWAGDLKFPVIVKPPQEDASLGITSASVVHEIKDLFARIDELQTEYQSPVLVEQFIEGREFYVGVLGNASRGAAADHRAGLLGISGRSSAHRELGGEVGRRWRGVAARSTRVRDRSSRRNLDEELGRRMQQVAIEAFHALRLRDYARIDLRVSDAGEIYVIEVNPNCYLERESEFARAAKKHGLEYEALIGRIVDLAMARYAR